MWWAIEFNDGSAGYIQMSEVLHCLGVYRADGTQVSNEEHVEYTCVDMNAAAPTWTE